MSRKNIAIKVITAIVVVVTLLIAGYIMYHRIGLADDLDFGAGAYFYADIPNFEKYSGENAGYDSKLPTWVAILLFLAWGALMWRLWLWVDKRGNRKD